MVNNPPTNAGNMVLIPGCGRFPGEGNGKPLQYSCLGNPMDRKGLMGYSPWGCKRVRDDLVTKQQQSQPQAMFSVHIYCLLEPLYRILSLHFTFTFHVHSKGINTEPSLS